MIVRPYNPCVFWRPALLAAAVLLGSRGAAAQTAAGQSESERMRQLNRQLVSMRETQQFYERQIAQLVANFNALQDQLAAVNQNVATVARRNTDLEERNNRLSQELAELKRLLAEESRARQADSKQLVDQVAKQTAAAINDALTRAARQQPPPPATPSTPSRGGAAPVGTGDFLEHKVAPGHTLSAIAVAYGVTVDDIRKANNLKSDIIRVDQILYVPKR